MVSSINTSVRVWTQQTALKAFNEASADSGKGTPSSSVASLADMLFAGTQDEGEDDTALSSLIASLQQQAMTGSASAAPEDDGSVEDISSNAFMKALQQKIEALAANPETKAMALAMQEALKAGTLVVTDAEAGTQIRGRDLTADTAGGDTVAVVQDTADAGISTIEISDWSSYLREHLLRDPYGKYVRNDDSSHRDKATGASGYFGMIADSYYYLSWNAPKPAADETAVTA